MKTRTIVPILILVLAVLIVTGGSTSASNIELFFQVIKRGDIAEAKKLIEEGADVDARDKDGFTALMVASHYGYTEVVKLLIDEGADVNAQENKGWTALMFASYKGHTKVAQALIEAGATLDAQNKIGATALGYASFRGHTEVVRKLIEAGADLNRRDEQNLNALTLASLARHAPLVELLLERGAEGLYFEGGDGSSIESAIVILGASNNVDGVGAESLWVGVQYPQWKKVMQTLLEKDGKHFDVITYSTPEGRRTLFFDIDDFLGKGFEDLTK